MRYVFETERLRVRKFEADDAERLYGIHQDEEVKKWMPNESYRDVQEARDAAAFFADCLNGGKLPCVLAVESKDTGLLIGDAGVNEVEGKTGEAEIGFVICRECRGKGYAVELLKAMTEFAASFLQADTLYGRVMKGNDASAKVLEKSGYGFVTEESGAEDDPYGRGMMVYMKSLRGRSAHPA